MTRYVYFLFMLPLLWAFPACAQQLQIAADPAQVSTAQSTTINVTDPGLSGVVTITNMVTGPAGTQAANGSASFAYGSGSFQLGPFSAPGSYLVSVTVPNGTDLRITETTLVKVFSPDQNNPAALQGQYTFYLTGQEIAPSGQTALLGAVGSFNADGQGHITSGVLDKNSAGGLVQVQDLTGTYQLTFGGKGQVSLTGKASTFGFSFYGSSAATPSSATYAIVAGGGTLQSASGQLTSTYAAPPYLNGNGTVSANLVTQVAPDRPENFGSIVLVFSTFSPSPIVGASSVYTFQDAAPQSFQTASGLYTASDPVTGRFTITELYALAGPNAAGSTNNYVAYPTQGGHQFFFLSVDPVPTYPLVIASPAN